MADGDICGLFVYIMLFLVVKKEFKYFYSKTAFFCTKNVVEYYYYNGCECTRALFKKKEKLVFRKKIMSDFTNKHLFLRKSYKKSDIVLKYFIYIFLRKQPKKSVICDIYIHIVYV